VGNVMSFPARQAEPGQRFNTRDAEQGEIDLVADEDGIVQPQTLAEHRAAESFGLELADGHEPYDGPLYTHPAEVDDDPASDEPTVTDLRAQLRELGLPVGGRKAELEARLATANADQTSGGDQE
jgi:hypothetical protein